MTIRSFQWSKESIVKATAKKIKEALNIRTEKDLLVTHLKNVIDMIRDTYSRHYELKITNPYNTYLRDIDDEELFVGMVIVRLCENIGVGKNNNPFNLRNRTK